MTRALRTATEASSVRSEAAASSLTAFFVGTELRVRQLRTDSETGKRVQTVLPARDFLAQERDAGRQLIVLTLAISALVGRIGPAEEWDLSDLYRRASILLDGTGSTPGEIIQAIGQGARGYILPAGRMCVKPPPKRPHPMDVPRGLLTPREIEIVREMSQGRNNQEIAEALGVRTGTVKTLARLLFIKLAARNRSHAVLICLRAGLIG